MAGRDVGREGQMEGVCRGGSGVGIGAEGKTGAGRWDSPRVGAVVC